ncbi:MAG: hypothetical protein IH597_08155 [Bacteroidales bacterium]|nr:hypothetical protein [Bacteroidales bacterium]
METITSIGELDATIAILKAEQEYKEHLLWDEFFGVVEGLKPINLLKDTFREGASSLKFDGVLGAIAGVAVGSLSRSVFVGASSNLFRKLLGTALQFGVTNIVGRNTNRIRTFGNFIAQRIFKRKKANQVNYDG